MSEGVSPDKLYDTVCQQKVEVVLTAHPTQVNRRTLQYKHTKIAALLQQNDRCVHACDAECVVFGEVGDVHARDASRTIACSVPAAQAAAGVRVLKASLWV